MFFCNEQNFSVEALHLHGANIVNFQLALGDQRWYIVGCYISPDNATTIEGVVADIRQRPRGAAMLVTGNFNSKLASLEGHVRDEVIAAALSTAGL